MICSRVLAIFFIFSLALTRLKTLNFKDQTLLPSQLYTFFSSFPSSFTSPCRRSIILEQPKWLISSASLSDAR